MVVHKTQTIIIPLHDSRRSVDISQNIKTWLENPQNITSVCAGLAPFAISSTLVKQEVDDHGSRLSSFRIEHENKSSLPQQCLPVSLRKNSNDFNISFRSESSAPRVCYTKEDPNFNFYTITWSVVEYSMPNPAESYLEVRSDVVLEPKSIFHYGAVRKVLKDSKMILDRLKQSIELHDVVAAAVMEEEEDENENNI
jgi:hypothetical protein